MTDPLSIIPITVVAAIVIFVAKEVIEGFRRHSANQRKVQALRALLARECELNLWTIKTLRRILLPFSKPDDPTVPMSLSVERTSGGLPYVKVVSGDGEYEAHMGIPSVHRELMSKFLLDIATLDKLLFSFMEPAYDELAEVEHVRESLININDKPEQIAARDFVRGFAQYAVDVLQDAERKLGALYVHCTGKPLEQHRLR